MVRRRGLCFVCLRRRRRPSQRAHAAARGAVPCRWRAAAARGGGAPNGWRRHAHGCWNARARVFGRRRRPRRYSWCEHSAAGARLRARRPPRSARASFATRTVSFFARAACRPPANLARRRYREGCLTALGWTLRARVRLCSKAGVFYGQAKKLPSYPAAAAVAATLCWDWRSSAARNKR